MPAIQTYEARAIRSGYRAYHKDHRGPVQVVAPAQVPGAVNILVRCEVHGRPETWKNIPRHSAVHAEPAAR
jgi:hypothetical protein